jgi:ubiquinone/menaquinone biosynthesis C-methylase UbiE
MELNEAKRQTQKQWDGDPCGAVTVKGIAAETLEFYREARRHRYEVYAPWFRQEMRFEEWRGKDVLEIGVGIGSDHFSFANGGALMTALDLSREHLRHTQKHLALEGLSTKAIYGDAEESPFPDDSFDLVYSFGVLHHTPDTQKAINEVFRVLKPGGTALIGLYHRNSFFFWLGMILYYGILHGRLITKGYKRLVSEIEYRSPENTAIPLVKLYSRRQVHELFRDFETLDLQTCHANNGRLSELLRRILGGLSAPEFEKRFKRFGWYLIARAKKPR